MAFTLKDATGTTQTFGSVTQSAELVPLRVQVPHTSGGLSVHASIDLDESEEEVKATAGQLYGYFFHNRSASELYVKFYNAAAASVTVGTTTPFFTLSIEPSASGHIFSDIGIAFSTGICIACTTGLAANDAGAPGANEMVFNVFYK